MNILIGIYISKRINNYTLQYLSDHSLFPFSGRFHCNKHRLMGVEAPLTCYYHSYRYAFNKTLQTGSTASHCQHYALVSSGYNDSTELQPAFNAYKGTCLYPWRTMQFLRMSTCRSATVNTCKLTRPAFE